LFLDRSLDRMIGFRVRMKFRAPLCSAVAFALCLLAVPADAEIVYLTSGKTLSIKGHRFDGEIIVLTLRGGGDVNIDKSLIEKILPDEVPYPEPEVTGEAAVATTGQAENPYGELIASMSEAHGVDPNLVRALIQVESNYRPKAKSPRGAMGLMQLMPSTAREYNVRNPYDPKSNVSAGVKHLKSLIDRWGVELALAAYNAGEGAVKKFNGIPPYRETRNYVSRILALAGVK
jgi:soluble lytic murein transglycosylase-like protein